MKKQDKERGITLVALVITIIILLILATISIQSLTNTGLFAKAQEAKDKSQNAEENQTKILNEYEDELNKYISGTVKETFKGKTVDEAIQYADVLNKDNNTELQDAYGNKIVVPAGFKITNEASTVDRGIVIEDATSAETAGSQFVWIPVGKIYTDVAKTDSNAKTIELGRYDFDETGAERIYSGDCVEEDNGDTNTTLKNYGNTIAKNITNFKNSVAAHGGYYIGRYEARTIKERTTAEDELTKMTEKGTDPVYNYVTQLQAANQAQKMYNSKSFTSDLTNSYAWDTAIIFIKKCTDQVNYANQSSLNNSFSVTGTNTLNVKDVMCNVFDMASNVKEWTTETDNNSEYPCVIRGGIYSNIIYCSKYRSSYNISGSYGDIGFRPILYLNF